MDDLQICKRWKFPIVKRTSRLALTSSTEFAQFAPIRSKRTNYLSERKRKSCSSNHTCFKNYEQYEEYNRKQKTFHFRAGKRQVPRLPTFERARRAASTWPQFLRFFLKSGFLQAAVDTRRKRVILARPPPLHDVTGRLCSWHSAGARTRANRRRWRTRLCTSFGISIPFEISTYPFENVINIWF